jgi:hypothetical protein
MNDGEDIGAKLRASVIKEAPEQPLLVRKHMVHAAEILIVVQIIGLIKDIPVVRGIGKRNEGV